MEENEYEDIINFKLKKTYPKHMKDNVHRSNYRKKCKKYSITDDILFFTHNKKNLKVIKKHEKSDIIEKHHIVEGKHQGINKT